MLLQKRNVLLIELLLQGLCSRGNYHAATAAYCRKQVGQRLSRARPGFHYYVMTRFKRVLHQLRHQKLRAPVLVSANHAALEQTARAKHLLHTRRTFPVRRHRLSRQLAYSVARIPFRGRMILLGGIHFFRRWRRMSPNSRCFAFCQLAILKLSMGFVSPMTRPCNGRVTSYAIVGETKPILSLRIASWQNAKQRLFGDMRLQRRKKRMPPS